MNTEVNKTNFDFSSSSSTSSTTSKINTETTSGQSLSFTTNTSTSAPVESMDLSFATDQVASDSQTISNEVKTSFSDTGEPENLNTQSSINVESSSKEPIIDSGSTYNPFGTDSTILGYEMTGEEIEQKISNNNEVIVMLDEQIAYYEQMEDDVSSAAFGWYTDFYYNIEEDFWGTLFRGMTGPPSNEFCLNMLKATSPEEFERITGYSYEEYMSASSNIMILKQYKQSLENENASLKYLQITEETSYKNYVYVPKEYSEIKKTYKDYLPKEIYNNMTDDEKKMLLYLENTYGVDKAIEYLQDMEDIWNQREGYLRAQERIDSLDINDEGQLTEELRNILGVTGDGFADGWNSFWEGFVLAFTADGKMSPEQYERMFYLSYLQQNTQHLDFWYNTGNAVGTMTPIVALTTISYIAGGYFGGGVQVALEAATPYVAGTLMALSSFGNTMDQTLYSGYSRDIAFIYSLCVAGSDALLEVCLGGINGIGISPKIGKNFLVQFLGQIGKEGLQEGLQTIIEMGIFDALILGKEINLDEMGEATLESILIGMIVAGSINVASGSVTMVANLTIGGVKYHLDTTQLKQALDLSKNENIPLTEAIKRIGSINLMPQDNKKTKAKYSLEVGLATDYETKKELYIAAVLEASSNGDWNLKAYIAEQNYSNDPNNTKPFYSLTAEERNALINQVDLTKMDKYELEMYQADLEAIRTKVAEQTIERIENLEKNGYLKEGYTAEDVLELIMSDVDPREYLSEAYVEQYYSEWGADDDGMVKVITFQSGDKGANNIFKYKGDIGIPGEGAFCMSYSQYQSLLQDPTLFDANGNCIDTNALMIKLGGVPLGGSVIVIEQTINIRDIILPNGGMDGAYIGEWCPGLKTSGDAVEGVAPFRNIFDPSKPGNVLADNVRVISHTEGFNVVDFLNGISRK